MRRVGKGDGGGTRLRGERGTMGPYMRRLILLKKDGGGGVMRKEARGDRRRPVGLLRGKLNISLPYGH